MPTSPSSLLTLLLERKPQKITRFGADPKVKAFWRFIRSWVCHNHKLYYTYVMVVALSVYNFWWYTLVGYYRQRNYTVSETSLIKAEVAGVRHSAGEGMAAEQTQGGRRRGGGRMILADKVVAYLNITYSNLLSHFALISQLAPVGPIHQIARPQSQVVSQQLHDGR